MPDRPNIDACLGCGAPLDVLTRLRGLRHCGAAPCRRDADERALAQKRAAIAAAAVRAAHAAGAAADEQAVLWLRHVPGRLERTTRRDRHALAEALSRRVAAAAAQGAAETTTAVASEGRLAPPAAPPPPHTQAGDPPPQAAALCALCRGHCCRHGRAQHAFIDATLLARWQSGHPGSSAGQAIEAYLAWLPPRHVDGSCLFHGEQGCTIPRAHRSDTCNDYACDTLRQLRRRIADDGGATVVLAVTTEKAQVHRAALLDTASTRPLSWRGGPRRPR